MKIVIGEKKKRIAEKEARMRARQRLTIDEMQELLLDLIDELRKSGAMV